MQLLKAYPLRRDYSADRVRVPLVGAVPSSYSTPRRSGDQLTAVEIKKKSPDTLVRVARIFYRIEYGFSIYKSCIIFFPIVIHAARNG
jgi:hypothetical protein